MWRPSAGLPFSPPHSLLPIAQGRAKVRTGMAALKAANSSPGEACRAGGSCSVAIVTVSLLTRTAGDGGPMAPNTQGQKADLP